MDAASLPAGPAPVATTRPPEELIAGLSSKLLPGAPPGFLIRAVIALRRFFLRLADAVVPSSALIFERVTGAAMTQLIGAAARHRIADLLRDGPLTAEEIAARTGTHGETMHRTLRALVTTGMFVLDGKGRFSNNRLSRALCSGELSRARDFAEYFASGSNVAAWGDYPRTLREGGNGFARVHGMSVWEWFDRHPDERETFAQAMMGLTAMDASTVAALYPFREIRRLCDVGGGRGTLLSELLLRHPHLEGVLCDGAGVIESAKLLLARRGVAGRVSTVAGSFFHEVPPGCDAYLMKNVLHDWDDERCQKILATCRRAMKPGDKMLLVESLLEKNDRANFASLADVQMMVVCDDGRERSAADFERLFTASGFRPGRIFRGAMIAVLEGIAV